MAANFTPVQARLYVNIDTGEVDAKGNPIIKSQRFSNLKPAATPDAVLAVGNAIASLVPGTVSSIQKNELSTALTE